MKFYDRERELKNLDRIQALSLSEGQMTVLVGWSAAYRKDAIAFEKYGTTSGSLFFRYP